MSVLRNAAIAAVSGIVAGFATAATAKRLVQSRVAVDFDQSSGDAPFMAATLDEWLAAHQVMRDMLPGYPLDTLTTVKSMIEHSGRSPSDLKLWNGVVYLAYAHVNYLRRQRGETVDTSRVTLTAEDKARLPYFPFLRDAMRCLQSAMTDDALRLQRGHTFFNVNAELPTTKSCPGVGWTQYRERLEQSMMELQSHVRDYIHADAIAMYLGMSDLLAVMSQQSGMHMQSTAGSPTEEQLVRAFVGSGMYDTKQKNAGRASAVGARGDDAAQEEKRYQLYAVLLLIVVFLMVARN